jgi:hypothetical protein
MIAKGEDYFLIAFGDIAGLSTRIPGDVVFARLFDAGLWYTARRSRILTPGGRVLFYQNRVGFRGHAAIEKIADDAHDAPFGHDHFLSLSQRLSLVETTRFATPLDPRPMVDSLDFISNKTHWGHSFRNTPRKISKKDYLAVLRSATGKR